MDPRIKVGLGVGLALAVGVVALVIRSPAASDDVVAPERTGPSIDRRSTRPERPRTDRPASGVRLAERTKRAGQDDVAGDRAGLTEESAQPRDGDDHVADAGSVRSGTYELPHGAQSDWDDPTNERVLGPREWMAAADPEERARVDEVFEKSRAARYDPRLSNRDRASSVAAVKAVVDACFAGLRQRVPNASGRLIVAWTAGAERGEGRVTNPRIKVNYGLEDDAFEACVLDGAQDLRFGGSDGEAIEVEAPFFYDGAF